MKKERVLAQAHPWHGISAGKEAPEKVNVFIEIVPTDTVKFEVDKESGHLRIDRPQRFSSLCPSLYGFIPSSYCDALVAEYFSQQSGRQGLSGDGDPLDICVLSERAISQGNLLVSAIPVGGLRIIDKNEVDDKIIAVLEDDPVYGELRDIKDCPSALIERLKHYFLTYKQYPAGVPVIELESVYGRKGALEVISRSLADYANAYV